MEDDQKSQSVISSSLYIYTNIYKIYNNEILFSSLDLLLTNSNASTKVDKIIDVARNICL